MKKQMSALATIALLSLITGCGRAAPTAAPAAPTRTQIPSTAAPASPTATASPRDSRTRSADGMAMVRSIGADQVIDYTREDFTQNGQLDEATRLLQRLLEATETRGHTSRVIEIRMLQALAYQARGDTNRAITTLEQALTLAERSAYGLALPTKLQSFSSPEYTSGFIHNVPEVPWHNISKLPSWDH